MIWHNKKNIDVVCVLEMASLVGGAPTPVKPLSHLAKCVLKFSWIIMLACLFSDFTHWQSCIYQAFIREQGWRSGESTRLPPMWPGFKFRRRLHMWVEFVVGSLPCSKRFFSGYCGFPLSSKTNISKFQFNQESGRRRTTMWMGYLQIVIYFFIYLCHLKG